MAARRDLSPTSSPCREEPALSLSKGGWGGRSAPAEGDPPRGHRGQHRERPAGRCVAQQPLRPQELGQPEAGGPGHGQVDECHDIPPEHV